MSLTLDIIIDCIRKSKYPALYIKTIVDKRLRDSIGTFPDGDQTGLRMCSYYTVLIGKNIGMYETYILMQRSVSMSHLVLGMRAIMNDISFKSLCGDSFHSVFKLGGVIGQSKYVVHSIRRRRPSHDSAKLASKIFPYIQRYKKLFPSRHCMTEYNIMLYLQRLRIAGTSRVHSVWFGNTRAYLLIHRYQRTLRDCVHEGLFSRMSAMKKLMRSLLNTLTNLHRSGVAHRDIKPCNLMFQFCTDTESPDPSDIILCDWDAATFVHPEDPIMQTHANCIGDIKGVNTNLRHTETIGTINYTPPEMLDTKVSPNYNPLKMDIWSVGCVFLYILTRETAFTGNTVQEVLASVHKFHHPKQKKKWFDMIRPILHESGLHFIDSCLALDPRIRSSASTLLEHPFLNQE